MYIQLVFKRIPWSVDTQEEDGRETLLLNVCEIVGHATCKEEQWEHASEDIQIKLKDQETRRGSRDRWKQKLDNDKKNYRIFF